MADELSTVVERILGEAWDAPVRLGEAQTLRDDKCYRFAVAQAPAGAPSSVVVKKAQDEPGFPTDPDALTGNPAQPLLEEWAGLEFLNDVLPPDSGLVPRFYGGDRAACVVVSEDLGSGTSLLDALRGTDPDHAAECLTLHARAVADLHTHTVGRQEHYQRIRDALGPPDVPRDWKRYGTLLATKGWGDLRVLRAELRTAFERIDQQVPPAFWDEYDALTASIAGPSPWRAYVHSDSCPDNTLLSAGRLRLLDFERGGYHLCLLDAAYSRLGMPHCYWANRVPASVTAAVERAYRLRLAPAIPDAADDRRFAVGMTEACAYWVISSGMWTGHHHEDFDWGSATWRQRVLFRLARFAGTTEEFAHLPAMGAAARETVRRLRRQWNSAPLPVFPAFRRGR